jgi:hypothetical protein
MNSPEPDPLRATPLPPGHPLAAQMEKWERLRDQLAEVAARLEYLHLMLRLTRR